MGMDRKNRVKACMLAWSCKNSRLQRSDVAGGLQGKRFSVGILAHRAILASL